MPADTPWDGLVGNRAAFLRRLDAAPAEKRTLVEELDASRSTVDRAIRRLTETGLVERGPDGYELTPMGRAATAERRRHAETQAAIRDAADVLAPLSPRARSFSGWRGSSASGRPAGSSSRRFRTRDSSGCSTPESGTKRWRRPRSWPRRSPSGCDASSRR